MASMPLFGVSLLLHAYVASRLVPALGTSGFGIATAALLVLSAMAMPFGFLARRSTTSRPAAPFLAWMGLLSMGLFSSLFVLTVLRDVTLLAAAAAGWLLPREFGWATTDALQLDSAGFVVLAALMASAWGFFNARRTASVVRVDIPLAGLPHALDGFSIAQISDVHVGPTIKRPYVQAIVDAVNALDADLVAVTGDLVDGSVAQLRDHVEPLAGLRSREGTFFVTGNHEYYSGAASWVLELRRLGFTVLLNEHRVVRRGDAAIVVAGVTDYNAGHFDRAARSDPGRALEGSPRAALRILLAHQPRSAAAAESAGFDLQLSGHTHGGQFLPWNFLVRLQQPFTAGLGRWGAMWVYTSRGTGYWGPPKRVGAPSEITLIRLVQAPREAAAVGRPEVGAGAMGQRGLTGTVPLQSTSFAGRVRRCQGISRVHFRSLRTGGTRRRRR